MKRFFLLIVPLLLGVSSLVGCDVHQWPVPHGDEPEPPTPDLPKVTIPLRLIYETDFYLWEHLYDPLQGRVEETNPSLDIFPDYPGTSSQYANVAPAGLVQVFVKAYPVSNPSQCVVDQSFTYNIHGTYDTDLQLEIPAYDTYDIVVWSHLLTDAKASPFYDPTSFSQVHIIADNYRGNTDYRDGFRGKLRINAAAETNNQHVVQMKRPMGKFELVTIDLSEFLDRETKTRKLTTRASVEDYRVVISFPMYYPSSYSALDDRLENASTGVAFATTMTVTGESEASLGFEYVLLNDISDSGVQTRVDVYRLDGTRVAGSATFTIPMRRNHHTLLRGAFLSMEGNGGVGIDPGFNGDHNVTWQ